MDTNNDYNRNNLEKVVKLLGGCDNIDSIIFDLKDVGVISERAYEELLKNSTTRTNLARNIVLHIYSNQTHSINAEIAKIFYKNGLEEIARQMDNAYTAYISTRDMNSEFTGELERLPNQIQPSASLPNIRVVPHSPQLPDSSIGSNESLDAVGKKGELQIKVIPSRFIYRGKEIYRNESRPRGVVFLANVVHIESSDYQDRNGSKKDVKNLDKLFSQMGYLVYNHNNPTKKELREKLETFSKDKILSQVDSCVVIVMSHGFNDKNIVLSDNRKIKDMDIMEYFNNKNCPLLSDKPKIFIFQYCRGSLQDVGVEREPFLREVANNCPRERSISTDGLSYGETISLTNQPSYSDMYCIYATIEGYVAYVNDDKGSWLIESICSIFMDHAYHSDIEELMKKVCQRIKNFYSTEDKGRKQVPECRQFSFDKYFYFNPQPLNTTCSSLDNLEELNNALPESMFDSYSSQASATPPHQRRQRYWESQSQCGTTTGIYDLQYSSSGTDLRSRHSSGSTSWNSQDLSSSVRPKHPSGSSTIEESRRFSFGLLDANGNEKENEFPNGRSEDVVDHPVRLPSMTGTSQDFKAWRLRETPKGFQENPYSLKRQLSIPSETEAMTKLTSLGHFLQANELDHYVDSLDPIKAEILKMKNKTKKKKKGSEVSSVEF